MKAKIILLAFALFCGGVFAADASGLELVSAPMAGSPGNTALGQSFLPLLSPSGRHALFAGDALGLTPNPSHSFSPQVFLRDFEAGTTVLVSVDRTGTEAANGYCIPGGLSADGQFAVFESRATNLAGADTNNNTDVFLRDIKKRETLLVSKSLNGAGAGQGGSKGSEISANGAFVVFESAADNLVGNDTNLFSDVFRWERATGQNELVSVGPQNKSVNAVSEEAQISGDGRYVLFRSSGVNLVAANQNRPLGEIYLRDMTDRKTLWVSSNGLAALSALFNKTIAVADFSSAVMSADSRWIAFNATVTNQTVILLNDTQTGQTEAIGQPGTGFETMSNP